MDIIELNRMRGTLKLQFQSAENWIQCEKSVAMPKNKAMYNFISK